MKKVSCFYLLLSIFGCFQAFGAILDTAYDQIGRGGTSPSALNNAHAQNFVDLDAEMNAWGGTPTTGKVSSAGSNLPVKYEPSNVPTTTSGSNLPVKRALDVEVIDNRVTGNNLPVKKSPEVIDAEWKPIEEPIKDPSRMLEYKTKTNGGIAQKIGYEGAGKLNVGQAVGGAIELATGSAMLGNSITKEGRVDAKDVAVGAFGGGLATHGAVNMLRSSGIPIDPVTTSIAVAAGAALGAAATATRIATQGDCFDDAVHGEYACCNTVAGNTVLSGGVLYDIGDATHCTGSDGKPKFGYITYCMQGSYKTDQGLKGKFLDDHWSDCEGGQWCPGYMEPENSDMKINTIAFWKHRPGGGHTLPCWKWECSDEGYIRQGNKCIPDPNAKVKSEDEQQPGDKEPDGTNPSETKKTCNDLYAGHSKRLACCKAGKTTKWTGGLDNGTCYCVVPETQQPDSNKSWNGSACIAKTGSGENCEYRFTKTVGCISINQLIPLQKDDLNGLSCVGFNEMYKNNDAMMQQLAEKYCQGKTKESKQQQLDKEKISKSKANLDAFFSKVDSDRSVWKNADGSFNGVRLASDLTAGVVLGTVGGVVSGVLIKKSQVEKGFDALNCTINGQKVADWGDEFSVGLRR